MVLRFRNYQYLLNAVTLGTSLTALFLLVRCSVPERDYADLNIGSAGNGGSGGDGDDGTIIGAGGNAGVGGAGGLSGVGGSSGGGQGGQGGAPPIEPVPCHEPDAGTTDAGTDAGVDAGTEDAGVADAVCECVDGDGTRACLVAPGLDCDDGDPGVTHNSCGGCSALPNAIGDDCGNCGAYACDGPDGVLCASKPDPLVDPDCRCVDGLITARDTDEDGAGTRLCEANPGSDCNDGDKGFITNECGGCSELPGAVGAPCNQCGVYACNGAALACVPSVGAAGQRCLDDTTRQTCVGSGFWGPGEACPSACYQGNCETCIPGRFQCVPFNGDNLLQICITDASLGSSSYGIGWGSYDSCIGAQVCDPVAGQCTGYLFLPRDRAFDVGPLERDALPWHDVLNTASDSDYG